MKKAIIPALLTAALLSCKADRSYEKPTKGVDSTHSMTSGYKKPINYMSYAGIKVHPDTVRIPKAVLKNIVDAEIATKRAENGFSHNYQMLIFDVKGSELVLATKKPKGVSLGSSYALELLEFFPNQKINNENFFEGFIKKEYAKTVVDDNYFLPKVLFKLEMSENIQGVLTKCTYLGNKWKRDK